MVLSLALISLDNESCHYMLVPQVKEVSQHMSRRVTLLIHSFYSLVLMDYSLVLEFYYIYILLS